MVGEASGGKERVRQFPALIRPAPVEPAGSSSPDSSAEQEKAQRAFNQGSCRAESSKKTARNRVQTAQSPTTLYSRGVPSPHQRPTSGCYPRGLGEGGAETVGKGLTVPRLYFVSERLVLIPAGADRRRGGADFGRLPSLKTCDFALQLRRQIL